MLNLDDSAAYERIDRSNLYPEMIALPEQLMAAWDLGSRLPLPAWSDLRQILIAGMGGSAIGADLLAAYAEPIAKIPIVVHRDYDLPAWASGAQTLVIASSHSGDTEETLSVFSQAVARGCRLLVVTTGGQLAELAQSRGIPVWQYNHSGQPRMAVGWSFGLLLAAVFREGLIPDPQAELEEAIQAMREQRGGLSREQPSATNPAKRQAGQLMGRGVLVLGAGVLAPVARRWKGQINELAKAWAGFEAIPEADHNTLTGISHPAETLSHTVVLLLKSPADHPRNRLRLDLTKKLLMLEGVGTDFYEAPGKSRLSNQWAAIHFGDYLAYYLALAYETDPTPIPNIQNLKAEMGAGT